MTWRRALYAIAAVCLVLAAGGTWYAVAVQPDPTVRTIPMAYQTAATAKPIPNTGVDAKGLTLDQFIAGGGKAWDYKPVESTTFQAGGVLYVLRYQEFRNKLARGAVDRSFLGGDGSAGPNRTMRILPSVPIPSRTDGRAVKNHGTKIPEDLNPPGVSSQVWTYVSSAEFVKNPMQAVRVEFTPVTITVLSLGVPAPERTGGKPK